MTGRTAHRLTLTPILLAATLFITGCEWDNSEDYETDNTEQVGGGNDGGTGNPAPEPDLPTVSGVAATSEPLENAEVCLDENGNGECESDEPSTVTDSDGRWTITLPDGRLTVATQVVVNATDNTTLADSGDPANWNYALIGLAEPNFTDTVEGVFVSPISTLVENEVNNLPSGDRDEAIRNIAGKLGTDVDTLADYINPPAGTTATDQAEYDRLQRIASVANELANQIDSAIPENERDNLSQQELDKRVFDQVNDGLEQIVEDVNQSLIEQPGDNFDAGAVIEAPEYDDFNQAPDTSEPSPTLTELESRIANAASNAPFFQEVGFETFPVSGSRLLDLHLFKNDLISTLNARRTELHERQTVLAGLRNQTPPPAPTLRNENQIYYEARRRVVVGSDADAAIADIQIGVPRNDDFSSDDSTLQIVSETLCDNGDFACDELSATVRQVSGLVWTGFSFRSDTIQLGHAGTQRYLPLFSLGEIVATSESTEFASEMNFGEFDLEGLDAVEVIDELVGGEKVPNLGSFTFDPGSKGYTFSEELVSEQLLSNWPAWGIGNLCDSPGLPDASVTGSCNLVYGEIGQSTGLPAETFSDALYPVSQQNSAYISALEDGKPVDALGLTGPTDDVYVARLFGAASNSEGVIRIYRQDSMGNWETLSLTGRWEIPEGAPFERIDLVFPTGFYYTDARLGFNLGQAYLYERQGYLRHGWSIPDGLNVDSLYGRKQVKYAFNQAAFDQIIADLDSIGALTEHPYYTRQLISDIEQAIADTNNEIDSEIGVGGGGGGGGTGN